MRCGRGRAAARLTIAAALLAAASPGFPQGGLDNLASVVTLDGRCVELVVRGADASADCAGHLINSAHTDGRSGFTFFRVGREAIDFAGQDSAAVGDSATLHVDMIVIARTDTAGPPRPQTIAARGECTYTTPYIGVATIRCTAATAQGRFSVLFRSDGRPPAGGRVK